MKAAALAGVLAAAACATAPVDHAGAAASDDSGSPRPGEQAPEFSLPTSEASEPAVTLASLRGSVVLLHFTASWCPYCREEIDALGSIARDTAARDVRVLLVDVAEPAERVEELRRQTAPEVTVLADRDGTVAARYAPEHAAPALERAEVMLAGSILIDRQGRITALWLPDSRDFDPSLSDVRARLARLLDEQGAREPGGPPQVRVQPAPGTHQGSRGGTLPLDVSLVIPPPYHVMSDQPSDPAFVATTITLDEGGAPWLQLTSVQWPRATDFRYRSSSGDEVSIRVFEGAIDGRAMFAVAADAPPGVHRVAGVVRYQACTASRCFMPRAAPFAFTVQVPGDERVEP